ncbi:MAG TPA: carbohydrate ABC transporter permease [Candidatus Didemnitutus sp.]|nr:carbohydrate ABC transporter permease [Candidatus Didemnitutus sp.]
MRPAARFTVYLLLGLGAALFLLPLVWMVLTALKPLEQTRSTSLLMLPRRYEAVLDGVRQEVRPGDQVTVPSVWGRLAGARQPVVLPADAVREGAWHPAQGPAVPVDVVKSIPAAVTAPWREITDLSGEHRDVVPVDAISATISFRWENFPRAIKAMRHFPRYFANTLLLCVLNVVGTVLSSSLVAYGFSRLQWRGRETLFALLLGTMMIPFPVVMVPLYSLFRWLGWVGTLQPLWVGSFFATAFNVFLLRQFFRTIPADLSEAARIDGCSEFRIYWQIILPLCRPALVVVALFTFMGAWNDFLGPLIYLTDEHDFTLALGLEAMKTSQSGATEWHYLMGASTVIILPVVALFLLAQRSFIEGVALTGSKF